MKDKATRTQTNMDITVISRSTDRTQATVETYYGNKYVQQKSWCVILTTNRITQLWK